MSKNIEEVTVRETKEEPRTAENNTNIFSKHPLNGETGAYSLEFSDKTDRLNLALVNKNWQNLVKNSWYSLYFVPETIKEIEDFNSSKHTPKSIDLSVLKGDLTASKLREASKCLSQVKSVTLGGQNLTDPILEVILTNCPHLTSLNLIFSDPCQSLEDKQRLKANFLAKIPQNHLPKLSYINFHLDAVYDPTLYDSGIFLNNGQFLDKNLLLDLFDCFPQSDMIDTTKLLPAFRQAFPSATIIDFGVELPKPGTENKDNFFANMEAVREAKKAAQRKQK